MRPCARSLLWISYEARISSARKAGEETRDTHVVCHYDCNDHVYERTTAETNAYRVNKSWRASNLAWIIIYLPQAISSVYHPKQQLENLLQNMQRLCHHRVGPRRGVRSDRRWSMNLTTPKYAIQRISAAERPLVTTGNIEIVQQYAPAQHRQQYLR